MVKVQPAHPQPWSCIFVFVSAAGDYDNGMNGKYSKENRNCEHLVAFGFTCYNIY